MNVVDSSDCPVWPSAAGPRVIDRHLVDSARLPRFHRRMSRWRADRALGRQPATTSPAVGSGGLILTSANIQFETAPDDPGLASANDFLRWIQPNTGPFHLQGTGPYSWAGAGRWRWSIPGPDPRPPPWPAILKAVDG